VTFILFVTNVIHNNDKIKKKCQNIHIKKITYT